MLESVLPEMVRLQDAFKNKNASELRSISNDAIRNAALDNDRLEAEIAVIAYALNKLLSKEHITGHSKWKAMQKIMEQKLSESIQCIRQKNAKQFEKKLEETTKTIRTADSRLGNFVQNLVEKSRVKQASSLYALGVSLGQATELTNADKKSLFNYIGYTKMNDEQPSKKTMNERVQQLEGILE